MSTLTAFLSYLLAPVVAPLVMLFRRKDYFALYHACQGMAIVAGMLAVALGWVVWGWLVSFVSITFPQIYVVPIVLALLEPIWGMFQRSRRYQGRGIWGSMAITAVLAVIFSWLAWKVIAWLSPNVLPLAGPLLQMSTFALVIAAGALALVGWLWGMVNALRKTARKVPLFGGWGENWFKALTKRDREALEASDAALLAAADPALAADLLATDTDNSAANPSTSDTPLTPSSVPASMDT